MAEAAVVPLRVAVIGLNALGIAAAKAVAAASGLRLAALVDVAAAGKTISDYGLNTEDDVVLLDDVEAIDAIDVAIVSAGPHLDRLAPTLRQLMFKKAHVVTNCEEMVWPWFGHPHLSDVLGTDARRAGVSLLGVGGDAGLTLMATPLSLATTVSEVRRVTVRRIIDATARDAAGKLAIGAGLTYARFRELATAGRIGRLGVAEAVVLMAQALGRHPMHSEIAVRVEPVVAAPGAAISGVHCVATYAGAELDVVIELTIATAQGGGADRVVVEGRQRAEATLTTTDNVPQVAAALVRAARATSSLPVGLRTVLDLPPYRLT